MASSWTFPGRDANAKGGLGYSKSPRLPVLTPRRGQEATRFPPQLKTSGDQSKANGYALSMEKRSAASPLLNLPKLPETWLRSGSHAAAEFQNLQSAAAQKRGPSSLAYQATLLSPRRKSPRKGRILSGLQTSAGENKDAYNQISPDVAWKLDAKVRNLVEANEAVAAEDGTGVYMLVERCHSCEEHHALTTRHESAQYAGQCSRLLEYVSATTTGVVRAVDEILCELEASPRSLGHNHELGGTVWHTSSRVGAFEVYLLTPPLEVDSRASVLRRADCSDHANDLSPSHARDATWGDRHTLPCGYVATLLHSKLASKAWPTDKQIMQRLSQELPRAVISVRLLAASCEAMFDVTVEASWLEDDGSKREKVFTGADGFCHVSGMPVQAVVTACLSHPCTRSQTFSMTASSLRMSVTLGADVFFRLWEVEVNGGLSVYASYYNAAYARIPRNARPFVGHVEIDDESEPIPVDGHLILPWTGFQPNETAPALAFARLVSLAKTGYWSALVPAYLKNYSMIGLASEQCLELATLSSPPVSVQVVVPASKQPIANVRVRCEKEQQNVVTDANGRCSMILRPGRHTLLLRHGDVCTQFAERVVEVTESQLAFRLSLPLNLRVWQASLTLRSELLGWDIWISSEAASREDDWQPFTGALMRHISADAFQPLRADNGRVSVDDTDVELLEQETDAAGDIPAVTAMVFEDVALFPPFLQRLGVFPPGFEPSGDEAADARRLQWAPRLLGTLAAVPSTGEPAEEESCAVVAAKTSCCGVGIAGIDVRILGDEAASTATTNNDGTCKVQLPTSATYPEELPEKLRRKGQLACVLQASHPALPQGAFQYALVRAASAAPPVVLRLPLLFQAGFVLCTTPQLKLTRSGRSAGCRTLRMAMSVESMPHQAAAFGGKLLGRAGLEVGHPPLVDDKITPIVLSTARLRPTAPCPLLELRSMRVRDPGFQFDRYEEAFSAASVCGLHSLLQHGEPLSLGMLRPVTEVILLDGKVVQMEECETAADILEMLEEYVGADAPLAAVEPAGLRILGADEKLKPGVQLRVVAKVKVKATFGSVAADVGFPNIQLSMVAGERIRVRSDTFFFSTTAKTDERGVAELFTCGAEKVLLQAQHPLLGPGRTSEVAIAGTFVDFFMDVPARLCIYRVPDDDEEPKLTGGGSGDAPIAPSTVWICCVPPSAPTSSTVSPPRPPEGGQRPPVEAHDGSLPMPDPLAAWRPHRDAQPVAGVVRLRLLSKKDPAVVEPLPTEEEVDMDAAAIRPILLKRGVDGLSLRLKLVDYLWEPALPWLLDSPSAWSAIMCGPVAVGRLVPPVKLRCHGFDSLRRLELLPGDSHSTAEKIIAALSERSGIPTTELGLFRNEQLLQKDDYVASLTLTDVWRLVPLVVRVETPCCMKGVDAAEVFVEEDHLMSGEKKTRAASKGLQAISRTDRCGTTSSTGTCRIITNVGQHTVRVFHPLLRSESSDSPSPSSSGRGFTVDIRAGEVNELVVRCNTMLQLYRCPPPSSVWLCVGQAAAPAGASMASETIMFKGARLRQNGPFPEELCNTEKGLACPLADLCLDVSATPSLAWCPQTRQGLGCILLEAAAGETVIGTVEPAFTVQMEKMPPVKLPVTEYSTVGAMKVYLAELLHGRSVRTIGILDAAGTPLDDTFAPAVGGILQCALLAPVRIQLLLPEGPLQLVKEKRVEASPLEGAQVTIDGRSCGSTDDKGILKTYAQLGKRILRVNHPCYGSTPRCIDVEVIDGKESQLTLRADVRVHVYATRPDEDEEEEDSSEQKTPPFHGEASKSPRSREPSKAPRSREASKAPRSREASKAPPTNVSPAKVSRESMLVWLCADRTQIPSDGVGVDGRAEITGLGGCSVSVPLAADTGPAEFVALSGDDAEAAGCGGGCSVSTLALSIQRTGFHWRPKDPSPLQERETDLGPGEYLRLLSCPVVLGFLDPVVTVQLIGEASESLELLAQENVTVEALRCSIKGELGAAEDFAIYLEDSLLEDNAEVVPHIVFEARRLVAVNVQASMSCCCEPLPEARVLLDGREIGSTDEEGEFQLHAAVGAHVVEIEHTVIGKGRRLRKEVDLHVHGRNEACFLVPARLYVYATDPEKEEEEEEEDAVNDDSEPMIDPSCVWLATDNEHIPDDAVPLDACVVCAPEGSQEYLLSAKLRNHRLSPFHVNLEVFSGATANLAMASRQCVLGCLRFQIKRRGFSWHPKDPLPTVERLEELQGCELLRLLACPVALGFLKPTITVHCADGRQLQYGLTECSTGSALRERVMESLELKGNAALQLQVEDGRPAEGVVFTTPAPAVLCAQRGESMAAAKLKFNQVDASDALQNTSLLPKLMLNDNTKT
eukprot:TRINITY_DN7474_c0_g1_i5.p1 TRINITY_DN7474_c0_g1~~TRINITY_DN7474_c0_g1_i5.p1  ORF type:complete len:2349 (-),score=462.92 TRINITY_DN7474_c0_g1_i5:203-7249(-)